LSKFGAFNDTDQLGDVRTGKNKRKDKTYLVIRNYEANKVLQEHLRRERRDLSDDCIARVGRGIA